jgi:hypothetical protein
VPLFFYFKHYFLQYDDNGDCWNFPTYITRILRDICEQCRTCPIWSIVVKNVANLIWSIVVRNVANSISSGWSSVINQHVIWQILVLILYNLCYLNNFKNVCVPVKLMFRLRSYIYTVQVEPSRGKNHAAGPAIPAELAHYLKG